MFLKSAGVDLTFEYPLALVHTCLLPKKCPKITQPLPINLKIGINLETCSSRRNFLVHICYGSHMFMVQKMSKNHATSHHKSQNRYQF